MWISLLKSGKVLLVKVLGVAGIQAGVKETNGAVYVTTRCLEWAIGAINSGGAIGVSQRA